MVRILFIFIRYVLCAALGLCVLIAVCPATAYAKAATIRLKNGGWIEGEVMAVVPDQDVSIRLADGTVRSVAWADVERIEEPPPPAAEPVAPPVAAPVAPPKAAPVAIETPRPAASRATLGLYGFVAIGGNSDTAKLNQNMGFVMDYGTSDLTTTFGGGGQFFYAFSRGFALGFLAQYTSWRVALAPHRNAFIDGAIAPRFQFQFNINGSAAGVFVQLPIGVGWVDIDDTGVTKYKWKTTPAFLFGFHVGLEVSLSQQLGGFASLGWSRHAYGFDTESDPFGSGSTMKNHYDIAVDQAMFQLGVSYSLSRL